MRSWSVMGHLAIGALGEELAVDRVEGWGWDGRTGWAAESGCEDPQDLGGHA